MPRNRENDEESAGQLARPDKKQVRARVEHETERRNRLGVPSIAGGVLFLLGGVIVSTTLHSLPTVGTIQGLAPALRGEANPAVSPGAAEVRFIDHHAFGLIAGNLLQAVAIFFLVLVLLFLLGAVRFRRPETSRVARPLVLYGGVGMVLVSLAHPLAQVLNAHKFVTGHDFTAEAVNHALTQSAVLEASEYVGLLAGLALAAGMVVVMLGATRTGLMARWTMYLGIFAALLAFTPFGLALGEVQQLIPAFWMVTTGILLMGRWPGGDPAAWAAGEARPWPSSAEARAQRAAGGMGGRRGRAQPSGRPSTQPSGGVSAQPSIVEGAANGTGGDIAPDPMQPARGGSSKRRRKRGARG
jgi:hypothetical protein